MTKTGDMTRGNPFKQILFFTVPILLGNVFQQLYSMADSIIVGRTVSSDAMAGVGSTGSITFLVLGLVMGLTAGFSVIVSNFYGAGNMDGVRRSIANSLILCSVLTVVLTSIAVPLVGPLLRIMNTPEQYFDYAYWYLFVVFFGIGASVLYNISSSILRSIGDSRTPLYFLILSAVLNVGLDLVFIIVFGLQKTGAGLATVISQFVSGITCLVYMFSKYPELRPKRADWIPQKLLCAHLVGVGLPMALQYAITGVGCIFRQVALNNLNSTMPGIVTSYAATVKVENLLVIPYNSLGAAMATYAGQNYGAKKYDRIRQGAFIGMLYSIISWIVLAIVCYFTFVPLMNLFIDRNSGDALLYFDDMIKYGKELVLYLNIFFPALGAVLVYRCTLQSIGKSATTMIAGTLELIGRCVMAFGLVHVFGYTSVLLTESVAWLCADVFLIPTFYITIKKLGSKPLGKRIFATDLDT